MQIIATMNASALDRLATRLAGFERGGRIVMAGALNAAGAALRALTVIAETAQTGLASDVIDRAQQTIDASSGSLAFTIVARGGSVRLKYFGAKEGGGGVTAHPWGRDTFYPGAFITSGRAPNRSASSKLNGQVYTNVGDGKWWGAIKQVRPGVFIPTELTRGETAQAFERGASLALDAIATRIAGLLN